MCAYELGEKGKWKSEKWNKLKGGREKRRTLKEKRTARSCHHHFFLADCAVWTQKASFFGEDTDDSDLTMYRIALNDSPHLSCN